MEGGCNCTFIKKYEEGKWRVCKDATFLRLFEEGDFEVLASVSLCERLLLPFLIFTQQLVGVLEFGEDDDGVVGGACYEGRGVLSVG